MQPQTLFLASLVVYSYWHLLVLRDFRSLVGSLNKIPLSIAGIVLFNVPTSLQNSASILFGKNILSVPLPNISLLLCINLRERIVFGSCRSCCWSCFCQSQNEGEVLRNTLISRDNAQKWFKAFPNSIVCSVELGFTTSQNY